MNKSMANNETPNEITVNGVRYVRAEEKEEKKRSTFWEPKDGEYVCELQLDG